MAVQREDMLVLFNLYLQDTMSLRHVNKADSQYFQIMTAMEFQHLMHQYFLLGVCYLRLHHHDLKYYQIQPAHGLHSLVQTMM